MESVQSLERTRSPGMVRIAGVLCAVGGAGWLVNGLWASAMGSPEGAAFVVAEVLWIVIQSLLLIGVIGLALSGAAPGWLGVSALGVVLLGRAEFVVAEVHSLAIGEESLLLPLGALITVAGMTLVGIAVLRARRWEGWRRFMPLLVGLYPFVAMFPLVFVISEPSYLSIAGWGLPWILLGYALWSSARGTETAHVR